MRNIIMIGAGGCGRETLQWIEDINRSRKEEKWNIKGFLDVDSRALTGKQCRFPVLSDEDHYTAQPGDVFVCCVGNSRLRKRVMQKTIAKGWEFVNIVHPTAVVSDTASLGEGVIIYPFALVSDNTEIGDGCMINSHTSVGHDSVLGPFCTISAHCDVTGMCRLEEGVFLGSGSKVVPGTKIGKNAFLCAGSVVMTRVRENAKVMGNPAKRVGL